MHRFKEERLEELKTKAEIANEDFDLLSQNDRIAFYESCEMTQIFLYDQNLYQEVEHRCSYTFFMVPFSADDKNQIFEV